ncbi:MAG: GNAT family N-acetyltransferase [Actinomycetota bacterium]
MTRRTDDAALTLRPYGPRDEAAVLELLTASLGGGPAGRRPAEFFRWKHLENPFGRSFLLLAEDAGRVVGLRAFMRWRFESEGRVVTAARAVDTATDPEYQGRGIFTRLTLAALDALRDEVDLIFNTPNEKSLPGYLKMGWEVLGTVPVWVGVRRPIRFARGVGSIGEPNEVPPQIPVSAPAASEVLEDEEGVASLLRLPGRDGRLSTPRDGAYLRWRYGAAPLLDYRAVRVSERGRLRGFAVFRVRTRGALIEASVADAVAEPGDVVTTAKLLRAVARASRVDHVAASFASGTDAARAARRAAFLRSRRGATVVVHVLGARSDGPDPRRLDSWNFTLGDLEVF